MAANTVCIAGGLGSVGRQLQRVLLDTGAKVRVLDVLDDTSAASRLQHSSVEYARVPLLGQGSTTSNTKAGLCQALSGVSTVFSVVTPDVQHGTVRQFRETNHEGIVNLLEACRETPGVERFVHASSLAVTNHSISSFDESEDTPMPDWDTYNSHYDITKRLGEEAVLAANSEELRTCALRIGGVISDISSYSLRRSFETGPESGRLFTSKCAPLDFIIGSDVAGALLAASQKLDHTEELPGQALFTTKCATNQPLCAEEIAQHVGDAMNWQVTILPSPVLKLLQGGMRLQYEFQKMTAPSEDELPGIPPHVFLQIIEYEQSFDNSKAHRILDWKPELTWKQGLECIIEDYRQSSSSNQ
jgi:nucleoside-diphosphate-sugar epimerase